MCSSEPHLQKYYTLSLSVVVKKLLSVIELEISMSDSLENGGDRKLHALPVFSRRCCDVTGPGDCAKHLETWHKELSAKAHFGFYHTCTCINWKTLYPIYPTTFSDAWIGLEKGTVSVFFLFPEIVIQAPQNRGWGVEVYSCSHDHSLPDIVSHGITYMYILAETLTLYGPQVFVTWIFKCTQYQM